MPQVQYSAQEFCRTLSERNVCPHVLGVTLWWLLTYKLGTIINLVLTSTNKMSLLPCPSFSSRNGGTEVNHFPKANSQNARTRMQLSGAESVIFGRTHSFALSQGVLLRLTDFLCFPSPSLLLIALSSFVTSQQ